MRTKVLTLSLVLLLALLPLAMQSGVAPPGLPELSVTVEDVSDVTSDPVEYVHVHTTATVTIQNQKNSVIKNACDILLIVVVRISLYLRSDRL